MPGGFPGGMPGGFPGGMPGGMPGGFPGGMPGGFGGGMPGMPGMSGGMPGMPGGMPGNVDYSKILNVSLHPSYSSLSYGHVGHYNIVLFMRSTVSLFSTPIFYSE